MSTRALTMANVTINDEAPCFVIAEIGHNHQGDLKRAKELFRAPRGRRVGRQVQKRENRSLFTRGSSSSPTS